MIRRCSVLFLVIAIVLFLSFRARPLTYSLASSNSETSNDYGSECLYVYDNWNFSTLPENDVSDIETKNTYIWTMGVRTDRIYRYRMDGTYDNWSIFISPYRGDHGFVGLDFNGTHFFVSCNVDNRVYAFFENGTFAGLAFSVRGQTDVPHGLVFDGLHFWVGEAGPYHRCIHRYDADGSYDGWSKELTELPPDTWIMGLDSRSGYWYVQVSGPGGNWIYRYDEEWDYDNWNLNVSSQDGLMEGVAFNGTHFWTIGNDNDLVYRYSPLNPSYCLLLDNHRVLRENFSVLNTTHHRLASEYAELESDFSGLAKGYSSLLGRHTSLLENYSVLQDDFSQLKDDYDALESTHEAIIGELAALRSLSYVLTIATLTLIAVTLYYAKRSIDPNACSIAKSIQEVCYGSSSSVR